MVHASFLLATENEGVIAASEISSLSGYMVMVNVENRSPLSASCEPLAPADTRAATPKASIAASVDAARIEANRAVAVAPTSCAAAATLLLDDHSVPVVFGNDSGTSSVVTREPLPSVKVRFKTPAAPPHEGGSRSENVYVSCREMCAEIKTSWTSGSQAELATPIVSPIERGGSNAGGEYKSPLMSNVRSASGVPVKVTRVRQSEKAPVSGVASAL